MIGVDRPDTDSEPLTTPGEDAVAVMDVVAGGGVAIIPLDVAYAIIGHSDDAIRCIFAAKDRSFDKPCGFFSNWELFNEIHVTGQRERDMVKAVVLDENMPFSVVAPYRADHPMMRSLPPFALERSTKGGTLDMLLNAGPMHDAVTREAMERSVAVVGSSANTSLTGSKFRLEDIDPPVRAAADIAIGGGLSKYHNAQGLSSTIIDLRDLKTVRKGVCYDQICDVFERNFGVDLIQIGMTS